jgi:hypothetical protein
MISWLYTCQALHSQRPSLRILEENLLVGIRMVKIRLLTMYSIRSCSLLELKDHCGKEIEVTADYVDHPPCRTVLVKLQCQKWLSERIDCQARGVRISLKTSERYPNQGQHCQSVIEELWRTNPFRYREARFVNKSRSLKDRRDHNVLCCELDEIVRASLWTYVFSSHLKLPYGIRRRNEVVDESRFRAITLAALAQLSTSRPDYKV